MAIEGSYKYNTPRTPSPLRESISAEDLREKKETIWNFSKKKSDYSLSVFINPSLYLGNGIEKNTTVNVKFKTATAKLININESNLKEIKLLNFHLKLARISLEINLEAFEKAKIKESVLRKKYNDYLNENDWNPSLEFPINTLFDAMSHSISCKKNIRDDKNEINRILLKISEIKNK